MKELMEGEEGEGQEVRDQMEVEEEGWELREAGRVVLRGTGRVVLREAGRLVPREAGRVVLREAGRVVCRLK